MAGFGDFRVAERAEHAKAHEFIVKTCAEVFENTEYQGDCSGFVKAVAEKLGVRVGFTGDGQANDIYDEITSVAPGSEWIQIGKGADAAVKAAYFALQGYFVIAAWKKEDGGHGHVAIVTDVRELSWKIPYLTDRNVAASWGVLDHPELAQDAGPIRASFGADKRSDVAYAAHFIYNYE